MCLLFYHVTVMRCLQSPTHSTGCLVEILSHTRWDVRPSDRLLLSWTLTACTCPVPEFCPPFLLCMCCCCPCIECFPLFWSGHTGVHGDCPVVRRRTARVTAARLKYRTAWARRGPKPAGLSWHPVEEMRADWDAARLSGPPAAGAALDASEGGPRWCSHW